MPHLKILNASRGNIHRFEGLKRRLYNCNASIYFNQQCLKKQIIPIYAKIKIPNTSPAHKYTQHKIPFPRIRDEIKYLHSKKQQLNLQIYNLHLLLADTWDKAWPYIQHVIEGNLQEEMKTRYKKLDRKLINLTQAQTITPKQNHTFYPRVVNNTDITFTDHEISLRKKGPNTTCTPNSKTGYKT